MKRPLHAALQPPEKLAELRAKKGVSPFPPFSSLVSSFSPRLLLVSSSPPFAGTNERTHPSEGMGLFDGRFASPVCIPPPPLRDGTSGPPPRPSRERFLIRGLNQKEFALKEKNSQGKRGKGASQNFFSE